MKLINLLSWDIWLNQPERKFIRKKIHQPVGITSEYFLSVHAGTEAAFRQLQFIGLRQQGATYKNGQDWLFHNDSTPSNATSIGSFRKNFEVLLGNKLGTWEDVLENNKKLKCLWELWIGFSKHVRNHIAHGVRSYGDSDLELALMVDIALIIEIEAVLMPCIGGGLYAELTTYSPRLPRGNGQLDVNKLLGIKRPRKPRPKLSNKSVEQSLRIICKLPIEV